MECYLGQHAAISRDYHIYDYDAPRAKVDDLEEPAPVVWTDAWWLAPKVRRTSARECVGKAYTMLHGI
jgi:hypothetical protein